MIVGHARFVSAGLYSYTSGANSQFQRLGEQIISRLIGRRAKRWRGGQRQPGARGKAIVAEMISAKTSIDHSCLCPCCLTSSDVITLPPHQRLASISTDHLSLSSLYVHLSDASGPIHTTRDCASVRAGHAHVHSYCHINDIIAVSHCTPVANVHNNNNNNNNRRCERDFILIPTHFYHATMLQLLRAFI